MSFELNPAQATAATTRGADLCVEAGAGTGKTRVLTERIVALVEEGADLARILAITFTEKAAHEMKDRLARALLARGVTTAREDVEAAGISTIHALCARLLREHAVEAGVDPAFVVLDERRADEIRREALVALVAELAGGERVVLEELAALRGSDPEATLLGVYLAARESVHPVGVFVRKLPPGPSADDALAAVRDAVARVFELEGDANDTWRKKIVAVRAIAAALPASIDDPLGAASVCGEIDAAFNLSGKAGSVKEAFAELRVACRGARGVLADVCQGPLRERLATVLERLEELHEVAKGHGAALDFSDLERRAVRLLADRPDVADSLRERYVEVLVDEFQDTSPIQAELFERIRPPHALFVVGDPKQSIYGFRGADVDVFLARKERVDADAQGVLVRLDESFRARPEVTGFVNRVFADGLSPDCPEAGVRGVPYEPLIAGRSFPESDKPVVEVLTFGAEKAHAGREAEAAWIARRIHDMVAGPSPAHVTRRAQADDEEDRLEPAGFGDVAILLRATPDVKMLERALTARDIPYLVLKGRGFYEAREVVDLGNLLAAVADPSDDVRLAAVLRSPCGGLSDDGLFGLTELRRRVAPTSSPVRLAVALAVAADDAGAVDLSDEDRARIGAFAATFRRLREARAREPLVVLVDRAVEETRLDLQVLSRPNGRQRAANLRKVRELALAADARGGVGLAAFATSLRDLRQREVRETEATVAGGGHGAVSILTVHAAKGLEFPIVFVPDLGRRERSAGGDLVAHVRDGVGLKGSFPPGHPLAGVAPHSHEAVKAGNEARAKAESMRLLYVAMTRAEERLVLTAVQSAGGRGAAPAWWARIAAVLPPDAPDTPSDKDEDNEEDDEEERSAEPRVVTLTASGTHPDVRVLLHPPHLPSTSADGAVRTLLHGVAKSLVAGRVPARTLADGAAEAASALIADSRRPLPPVAGTLYATTVSALVALDRCPEEFRRRHLLGIPESLDLALALDGEAGGSGDSGGGGGAGPGAERPGDDDEWGVPLSARAKGRAAHLALERLAPAFDGDLETVVRESLATETGGAPPSPDEIAELVGWVRGFRDGDVGRALAGVARAGVRREQPVLLRSGRTVVRGQIDLLFHDGQGWTIVDYKAGALDAVGGAYELQMRLYALALQGVSGQPPRRMLLWSLPDARAVEVEVSAPDMQDLRDGLLADFARRTAEHDFTPPAERPCYMCAYRTSCALSLAGAST